MDELNPEKASEETSSPEPEQAPSEPTAAPAPEPTPQAAPEAAPAAEATGEFKYAGFWIRFLALILDGIVLGLIGYLVAGGEIVTIDMTDGINVSVNFFGANTIIPIIYTLGFWMWKSATPGKMILGLKIVETDGKNISVVKAVIRYLGYIVSGIVFLLGFIWAAFDGKKQGWHDKIAGTYVVKG